MDLEQIKQLMTQLEQSKLTKLVLKKGDFELRLEKEAPSAAYVRTVAVEPAVDSAFHAEAAPKGEKPRPPETSGNFVKSPMVGTFYSSPGPGQGAFVKVGDRVTENTVICIVEAMKVMNEVKAGVSGVVAEILVDNAHPVEFGTKILRIV